MKTQMDHQELGSRTIADFGDQWTRFQANDGYYGSGELFADIVGPLLSTEAIRDKRVAEIGSGTGRIVQMLLDAGAAHVVALEPSAAFDVLRRNVARYGSRVECIRTTGEHLPADRGFDLIFSIGVLHHVPDPAPVVRAALQALKPRGQLLVWLYGREGNHAYLRLVAPVRAVSTRLPHKPMLWLSRLLNLALKPYIACCRRAPLPLRGYLLQVFDRMDDDKRVLIIYDQLRPAYAKYYRRREALELLTANGFSEVRAYHRHGYSWTVLGTKPEADQLSS
jgi:SAM-dependent methyltransferase